MAIDTLQAQTEARRDEEAAAIKNAQAGKQRHEEHQYLDLIRDIMERGQVRVSAAVSF